MKANLLVGKTISRVIQVRCPEPDGRGHKEHELDAIVFTDGSVLRFNVLEHDDSDYGIHPVYPARGVTE